jgi:hypothetical protein
LGEVAVIDVLGLIKQASRIAYITDLARTRANFDTEYGDIYLSLEYFLR